jgi:hypothetical protein
MLTMASSATAHSGGYFTNRYSATIQARYVLMDMGWYPRNLRCGSSSWTVGKHFPCTFTRIGRQYIVCYHALDYDFGVITSYNRFTCTKYY